MLVTLIPLTLKISTSVLVMSFLALCFQGTRKMVRAESIQRSPGYLPLLMAVSSHGPNRSFWASLRARDRHRGNRGTRRRRPGGGRVCWAPLPVLLRRCHGAESAEPLCRAALCRAGR